MIAIAGDAQEAETKVRPDDSTEIFGPISRDLCRGRRGLFRRGSVPGVAELQRVASLNLIRRTVSSNVAMLHVSVQVGRDAAGPLRGSR